MERKSKALNFFPKNVISISIKTLLMLSTTKIPENLSDVMPNPSNDMLGPNICNIFRIGNNQFHNFRNDKL